MTAPAWLRWARVEWPGLTDEDISTVLWQCTSYPLGYADDIEAEFQAVRDAAQGDLLRALETIAEERER